MLKFSTLQLPNHLGIPSNISQRILMICCGALFPLGFSPFDYWLLSFISILILVNEVIALAEFLSIEFVNKEDLRLESKKAQLTHSKNGDTFNPLSLFSLAFYWGVGAFGVGVSWVYVSIHDFGHVPVLGAIAISLVFVLFLSLIKAIGFFMLGKLSTFFGKHLLVIIIPLVWVVFDFFQATIFNGFPWLFLGYTQIDGPLWTLATWIGVHGVSWFLLAIGCCLVLLSREALKVQQPNRSTITLFSVMLFSLISVPLLSSLTFEYQEKVESKSLNIALVQPNIAQEKKWERQFFPQIIDILYLQSADHWKADLIVWPEGAIPAYKHQVEDIIDDLNRQAIKTNTDLLLGLPVYERKQKLSYAALIALGKNQQTYHKQVLVPFGEYVPLSSLLRGLIEFLNLPMSSFSPATSQQQAMVFSGYDVIPAICYEITYSGIVHDLILKADNKSSQPKLLVTVSNDAWFGDSFGPYQHMQMARMRALELGTPLVRSTNDGITSVVDARGNVLNSLPRYQQATLSYELSLTSYQTLYRTYGLNGIYLILLLSGLILGFNWLFFRQKSGITISG